MADNTEKSAVDSAVQTTGNAIKMGSDAARAAKAMSKAAAQAATGNVAGAAVQIAKNSKVIKGIVIGLLILSLLIMFYLYSLPSLIYESVMTYIEALTDEILATAYEGDTGEVVGIIQAAITAPGRLISDLAIRLWNTVKGWFTSHGSPGDIDDGSEVTSEDGIELWVSEQEDSTFAALTNKIESCQNKIEARCGDLANAINGKSGSIDAWYRSYYAGQYDIWGGTTVTVYSEYSSTMSEADKRGEALNLLSLYTAMTGATVNDLRMSDFLRWLGYRNEFETGRAKFLIGNIIECDVQAWRGTFLPQYLYEQSIMEQSRLGSASDYSDRSCPLVDLLLVVDSPDLSSIPLTKTYRTTHIPLYDEGGEPLLDEDGNQMYREKIEVIGSITYQAMIRIRSTSEISDVVGLWAGDLSGDGKTPTRSNYTSVGDLGSSYYFEMDEPDLSYHGHAVNGLTATQIANIKNTIFGEFGSNLGGAICVAQSIRDNVDRGAATYDDFVTACSYDGGKVMRSASTYDTALVQTAFDYVFNQGGSAVQHPIYCFYAPLGWLQTDADYQSLFVLPLIFVIQIGNARFFSF